MEIPLGTCARATSLSTKQVFHFGIWSTSGIILSNLQCVSRPHSGLQVSPHLRVSGSLCLRNQPPKLHLEMFLNQSFLFSTPQNLDPPLPKCLKVDLEDLVSKPPMATYSKLDHFIAC